MDQWQWVAAVLYLAAGAVAARWNLRHGEHRPEASTTARVVSSVVVGMAWPWLVVDLWLGDPDDTRRVRRR